jgi:ribokinase
MPRAFVLSNFIQVGCWFISRLPTVSDTLLASKIHFEAGGKGLNVTVGLQRLGIHVDALVGIGRDAPAQALLDLFRQEQLGTTHVHQFEGSSGWGSAWIGANGQYAGAVYLGANLALRAAHVQSAKSDIQAAQLVYGQFETSLEALQEAFVIAHAHGIVTVLNPSPWQTPPLPLHHSTHTLLVNEVEAQYLLALHHPLITEQMTALSLLPLLQAALPKVWASWPSVQRIIITLGRWGALAFERSGSVWLAAAPAVQAIDSVGAGDAFACGFCCGLLAHSDLPAEQALAFALRAGNACGAYLVTQTGVLTALPGSMRLAQLLEKTDLPEARKLDA